MTFSNWTTIFKKSSPTIFTFLLAKKFRTIILSKCKAFPLQAFISQVADILHFLNNFEFIFLQADLVLEQLPMTFSNWVMMMT